jgi:hypothetical protein
MKAVGKFIHLQLIDFARRLSHQNIAKEIMLIQHHHTYISAFRDFDGNNHFNLCSGMERAHLERGFAEIVQNITTFPDGKIMVCRTLNHMPAGIKGANTFGI